MGTGGLTGPSGSPKSAPYQNPETLGSIKGLVNDVIPLEMIEVAVNENRPMSRGVARELIERVRRAETSEADLLKKNTDLLAVLAQYRKIVPPDEETPEEGQA